MREMNSFTFKRPQSNNPQKSNSPFGCIEQIPQVSHSKKYIYQFYHPQSHSTGVFLRSCLCHLNTCAFPWSFRDAVWHQRGSERDSPPPRHHINHQLCLFERLLGMRERWRDEQGEEGKETVIISLSEKYKV